MAQFGSSSLQCSTVQEEAEAERGGRSGGGVEEEELPAAPWQQVWLVRSRRRGAMEGRGHPASPRGSVIVDTSREGERRGWGEGGGGWRGGRGGGWAGVEQPPLHLRRSNADRLTHPSYQAHLAPQPWRSPGPPLPPHPAPSPPTPPGEAPDTLGHSLEEFESRLAQVGTGSPDHQTPFPSVNLTTRPPDHLTT